MVVCRNWLSLLNAQTHKPVYPFVRDVLMASDGLPQEIIDDWVEAISFEELYCPDAQASGHLIDNLGEIPVDTPLRKFEEALQHRLHTARHSLEYAMTHLTSEDVRKLTCGLYVELRKDYDIHQYYMRPPEEINPEEGMPLPLGTLPPDW